MRRAFKLEVAVECYEHGRHIGTQDHNGDNHCAYCGAYSPEVDEFCTIHDFDYQGLYKYDNHCVPCRMEADRDAQFEYMMTRDPMVEPW